MKLVEEFNQILTTIKSEKKFDFYRDFPRFKRQVDYLSMTYISEEEVERLAVDRVNKQIRKLKELADKYSMWLYNNVPNEKELEKAIKVWEEEKQIFKSYLNQLKIDVDSLESLLKKLENLE